MSEDLKKNENNENQSEVVEKKVPTLAWALLAFCVPVSIILYGIIGLGIRPPIVPLIFAVSVAAILCMPLGYTWEDIQSGMFEAVSRIQIALMILVMIGLIIAAWMASGTIPAIIYFGLKFIAPEHFMVSCLVLCSIASLATGTSFGTIGTIGVALLGVGTTLGYPPAMTVGAIVSGAFLGDKMSPVSDTCNLAASVCEVNLFQHIGSLMWTTIPAFIFSIIAYSILGFSHASTTVIASEDMNLITSTIANNFSVSWYVFLPPMVLFALAILRFPVLPVMAASLVTALAIALFDGVSISTLFKFLTTGHVSDTGLKSLDKLLSAGGVLSVAPTILLGYMGVSLGGILEKAKVLDVLIEAMLNGAKSTLRLVMSALAAGYIVLLGTGAQLLAVIIPGRAFFKAFKDRDISPLVLSRCCEDAGTLGSPLIPWSVPSFYILGVLGCSSYEFAPYAFLCWSVPIFSAMCAITGFGIWRQDGTSVRGLKK